MTTFEKIFNAESIDFQSTKFFDELTNYYTKFDPNKPVYTELEKIIKDNTNITVEISDSGFWATSILMLGQNHVLFKDIFDQYKQYVYLDSESDLKSLLNKEKDVLLKGYVDRKKSKVFGIFENLKFTLWINSKDINRLFTPQECAAVTLHEVGHQFTTFELLGEETYKNYALVNSLKAAGLDNGNPNKKVYLAKCAKDLKMDKEHSDSLVNSKSKDEAYLVILDEQKHYKNIKSNLTTALQGNTYHSVNSEWVADDFATRHGAGEHITTSLHKMIDQTSSSRTIFNVISILTTYIAPILMLGPVGGVLASAFFVLCNIYDSVDRQLHKRYDQDKNRFARIRNTMILQLRTGDHLSDQQRKEILTSLDIVQSSMDKVQSENPMMTRIYDWVATLVSKDMSLSVKQEKFQKEIEFAANNILYEKALKAKFA